VRYLGASVPTADLAEYLELQQPLALALSVSIPSALPSAVRAIEAAHALRVPVVVGGSAVTPQRARRLGADAYASDARDAASVLERWQRDPVVDLGAGPSPLAERDTFERHAHSLVASSVGTSSPGQARDMRLEDEIERVVRVVEAGLLLDDRPLVAEHVGWLRQVAPLHGIGIDVLDAALSRLVAALADGAPRASEILRSAMR
jgi:hypothetical protein